MATALITVFTILELFIGSGFGQIQLCTVPQKPPNGQVNCVNDTNELKCYATCNSGFTFLNASVEFLLCNQVDGSWPKGQTFPNCIESGSRCSPLSPPKNGIVKCETINHSLVCTAKCDRHYIFPTGQTTIRKVCDSTTGWKTEDSVPNCSAECRPRYLISGSNDTQVTDFIVSSTLTTNDKSYTPGKSDIKCSTGCGWRPTSSDLNQFIQIDLIRTSRLLGIITKGIAATEGDVFVTRFRILHSLDGRNFEPYSDLNVTDRFFPGNMDGNTAKINTFSCPFNARYIRINPLEWNGGIGFRFDLLGCDLRTFPSTTPSSVTQVTTEKLSTPRAQVTVGTTVKPTKSCSAILPPANGAVNCQKSTDLLSCTALCNDGFHFATGDLLVKLTCQLQTGLWSGHKEGFPACIEKPQVPNTTPHPRDHECVSTQSDCNRLRNGDFQTCGDCRYFATCSEGVVYIRPCPENLVFDSISQTCQFVSHTCHSKMPFG